MLTQQFNSANNTISGATGHGLGMVVRWSKNDHNDLETAILTGRRTAKVVEK